MSKVVRVVATIAAIVAGVLLIGPQMLGGPLAAVSTFGESMLPTYRPHELVVIRKDSDYEVGEIVAYRSPGLGSTVLHRIAGSDEQGLMTQGDNNDWIDQDRPTPDDVIGQAWFSIPRAGRLLELPTGIRIVVPLVAVAAIWLTPHRAGLQEPSRRRHIRQRRRSGDPPSRREPHRAHWAGTPTQVAAVGGVVLLVGVVLAGLSWTRPTSQSGPVDYEHAGRFSYHADVPASPVYSDGSVDPGETVFLRLADRLDVSFEWTFAAQRPADVHGTGQLVASVSDGSGWSRTVPVGTATEWTGSEMSLTGQLDLARILSLIDQVAQTTGVAVSNRTIELTADLTIEGTVDGAAITSDIDPTITFRIDELRAVLATAGDVEDDPLQVTETGQFTVPDATPAQVTLAGRSLRVGVARPLSLVAIASGLAALVTGAVLARRRQGWDEHRLILERYGDRIVHVAALSSAGSRSRIPLPSIDHLVEVAEHRDLPVLRVPMRGGGYGYVVDDTTSRFRYIPDEGSAPSPTIPDPEPTNGTRRAGLHRTHQDGVPTHTGVRPVDTDPPEAQAARRELSVTVRSDL